MDEGNALISVGEARFADVGVYDCADTVVDFARHRDGVGMIRSHRPIRAGTTGAVHCVDRHIQSWRRRRATAAAPDGSAAQRDTFAMMVSERPSLLWTSRALDCRFPDRSHALDVFVPLLHLAARRGYSVYYLAATWQTAQAVVSKTERAHPAVVVAGWQERYWRAGDTERIVAEVHATRPDMVFVGSRDPRNEGWLLDNFASLDVPFACGVGRAFDLYSGRLRPAPRWAEHVGVGDTWVAVRDSAEALGGTVARAWRGARRRSESLQS